MKTHLTILFALLSFLAQAQSPDTAAIIRQVDSLIKQATQLRVAGNSEAALPLADSARALAAGQLGELHPRHATALYRLADVYDDLGQYDQAMPSHVQAKTIWEATTGKEHPDYAWNLNNLGDTYSALARFDKAEPCYLEARDIIARVAGKESRAYAIFLHNLAGVYADLGQYEKSESMYLEAREAIASALGRNSPKYALNTMNFANLYFMMGQYDKAEPLYHEAIAVYEKVYGKDDPLYALAQYNYANLLMDTGQYGESEQVLLEVEQVFARTLGIEHPYYAGLQNSLSNLYRYLGQLDKAEALLVNSKDATEKTEGKKHPDYFIALLNLGQLYREMGQFDKAERYLSEALNTMSGAPGKEHPLFAEALGSQADLYFGMKRYEQAESTYLTAIAIVLKTSGQENTSYINALNNLADVYQETKQYGKAIPLYEEALNLYAQSLGTEHIFYQTTLGNLAATYSVMGAPEKATSLLAEASRLNRTILLKKAKFLSEQELAGSIEVNEFEPKTDELCSFTQQYIQRFPEMAGIVLDNALFLRGFIQENVFLMERFVSQAPDSTRNVHSRWKGYNRRLAAEYTKPIAEQDRAVIVDLEGKANALEKQLTRTVAGFREALRPVNWQDVQAALKPGEAVIEFVRYRYYGPQRTDSVFYSALLLRAGVPEPRFVALCEEKEITALLDPSAQRRMDYVTDLYQSAPGRSIVPVGHRHKPLFDLLWAPLMPLLDGVKTIYFSSSGLLHRLNAGAIAMTEDSLLADRYELVCLGSTRQLLDKREPYAGASAATVYGGVFYDMDSSAIAGANSAWATDLALIRGGNDFCFTDSSLRAGAWNYLKWTDKEATAIADMLTKAGIATTLRKGYAATEESFKHLEKSTASGASPRIIHVSTHGYFFPDLKEIQDRTEPVFKASDQPLIRSGLLLAGANHAWSTGKPLRPGMEDGILTAYEISQLNLSNTELVVLSACETGLGDIVGNEGVYGLQRAFKIAGARYVIMSLWQVPDFQTQQLMTAFYRHWLNDGMTIRHAFHAAQQAMRARGLDPYFWAGFVLVE